MDQSQSKPDPPDPVTALSNIQDDRAEKLEAHQWATEELLEGRSPEELHATMMAEGWDPDTAEEIIESARKETRAERGVVTREDIVRDLNADHRRATNGISIAFRHGLFGFIRSFIAAMRSADKLKRIARKK